MVTTATTAASFPPVHDCTDCDGRGGTADHDDGRAIWWMCEGCSGSGEMTSCRYCGDPMSVPEADREGYRCATCVSEGERGDREHAIEFLRRM